MAIKMAWTVRLGTELEITGVLVYSRNSKKCAL